MYIIMIDFVFKNCLLAMIRLRDESMMYCKQKRKNKAEEMQCIYCIIAHNKLDAIRLLMRKDFK